jgi:hypothetical protein
VTEEGADGRDGGVLGLLARSDSGRLGSVDHLLADNSLVALVGLDSVEGGKAVIPTRRQAFQIFERHVVFG